MKAAPKIVPGDLLPLRFLELFAPAVLVLACKSLAGAQAPEVKRWADR